MMACISYNKYKNNNNSVIFLFSILCFATLIPKLYANIADFDPYLEKRAEEALKSSLAAYNEHPEDLTQKFYREVGETLLNNTRRHLKEEKRNDKVIKDDKDDEDNGECKAYNPIDQCWRCNKDWADNRKALADCAKGFGHGTTGGKDGSFYVVTDPSDDNVEEPVPGTLRHAVIQDEPLWIIFEKSMIIRLKQELMINSDKTIDGRGVSVHIAYGAGLTLQFVQNVIIHNIRVHHILSMSGGMIRDSLHHIGLRTVSDGDAISLFGANRIWIDHCTLTKSADGLIDAIMASTAITISNCKFNHHNDVMLLGANDAFPQDKIMQVTIAFNRFGKGCIQRMPRCRWGFFHVVNNDYARWEMYAIGGTANPTIISQGNRFKADDNLNTKEVTNRNGAPEFLWRNWQWRSEGDLFKNGAFFRESGPDIKRTPFTEHTTIPFLPAKFVGRLTRKAGVIKCKIGREC